MKDRPEHLRAHRLSKVPYKVLEPLVLEAGVPPRPFFQVLQRQLRQTADPNRALTNLRRFLERGFTTGWLRDFHSHPPLQQMLLDVFSQSQYLADILVRDPQLFRWMTAGSILQRARGRDEMSVEAGQVIKMFARSEKRLDGLKRFHRRELLRIGTREILGLAAVDVITRELSDLADTLIGATLTIALDELRLRSGADFPSTLSVIGLGKLGGSELNFSSDVDLMFIYDSDGELDGLRERIGSFQEFYTRLCEMVVRYLTSLTNEGHLYRVDMRLRPDGVSGPLVMSRQGYLLYYEHRGEHWERQMLLKARIVAGDEQTGTRFLSDIAPFVYKRTAMDSPLAEISTMKVQIEKTVKERDNVKLGVGGIRDIEFAVQALQLLRGGTDLSLRVQGTLKALSALADSGLVSPTEKEELTEAYRFLRSVEHRLQLLHGVQVHSLPVDPSEYRLLARRLGFKSPDLFKKRLNRIRGRVRKVYESVFAGGQRGGRANRTQYAALDRQGKRALGETTPPQKRVADFLAMWHEVIGYLELGDQRSVRNRFAAEIRRLRAPVWTIQNVRVLANAEPIRRSLVQAVRNPEVLALLLLLSARSRKLTYLLSVEPLLFESLLGQPQSFLGAEPVVDFMLDHDPLRYRMYNEFRIALRFLSRAIRIRALTTELSDMADRILTRQYELVVQDVAGGNAGLEFCVLGLGKVGGKEITFGSDIDCVFLFRDPDGTAGDRRPEIIARKMMEHLGSAGVYQIDARLRPEGNNAPLVTEFEYFKRYLSERASLWERQALIKARFICGHPGFGNEAVGTIHRFVYEAPLPKGWTEEIRKMRQRVEVERGDAFGGGGSLKTGKGGLVDLEFAVQALQLLFGGHHASLRFSGTFEALSELGRIRQTKAVDSKKALRALEYFRTLETLVRLNADTSHFQLPRQADELQAIAAGMSARGSKEFSQMLRRTRSYVRSLFRNSITYCKKHE